MTIYFICVILLLLSAEYNLERNIKMDTALLYALTLFSLLPDQDKDDLINLMLSLPSLRESVSDQKD